MEKMVGAKTIELGVSTACFYPAYLEDAIEELGRHGVKTIEIFANTESEMAPSFLHRLKRRLDYYDIQVVSLHPFTSGYEPFLLFTPYERRFQDGLEQYRRYFHAAGVLGAKYLVFHGNHNQSPFPQDGYYHRFGTLRAVGKKQGVLLAQENVAPFQSHDPAFLRGLRQYLQDDVDFVLDIKQAVRAGKQVDEFLSSMQGRIAHLHLSDHTATQDCLPIGAGTFDFTLFFQKLLAQGYQGAGVLELYRNNYGGYQTLYDNVKQLNTCLLAAQNNPFTVV